jgi:hypothetical protein
MKGACQFDVSFVAINSEHPGRRACHPPVIVVDAQNRRAA